MRILLRATLLCLSFTFIFSSCVSKKKYTELMSNKESVDEMLAESKKKASGLEDDLKTMTEEKDALASDYDADKQKWSSELSTMEKNLQESKANLATAEAAAKEKDNLLAEIRKVFSPYEGNGMSLAEKNGRIYITMASPVTYRSGSTRIPKDHMPAIESLASLLQGNPSLSLLVEGHTDGVPMKEGARFSNNVQLSMARANRVVRKLVKLGANSNQLTAVGRGSNMPAASEDGYSAEAQQLNRRTEFVIIPSVSNLYKINTSGV